MACPVMAGHQDISVKSLQHKIKTSISMLLINLILDNQRDPIEDLSQPFKKVQYAEILLLIFFFKNLNKNRRSFSVVPAMVVLSSLK